MTCAACHKTIQTYPCACGYEPTARRPPHLWIVQQCTMPGCQTAIRSHDGLPESALICKWCRPGSSQARISKTWPDGMPDPARPWPWLTDQERARRLRLPFWRDRLARQAPLYEAWLTTPPLSE